MHIMVNLLFSVDLLCSAGAATCTTLLGVLSKRAAAAWRHFRLVHSRAGAPRPQSVHKWLHTSCAGCGTGRAPAGPACSTAQ